MEEDRIVVREPPPPPVVVPPPKKKRFSFFSRNKSASTPPEKVATAGLEAPSVRARTVSSGAGADDDLPERVALPASPMPGRTYSPAPPPYTSSSPSAQSGSTFPSEKSGLPLAPNESETPGITPTAGFDFKAIGEVLGKTDLDPSKIKMPVPSPAVKAQALTTSPASGSGLGLGLGLGSAGMARSESAPPSQVGAGIGAGAGIGMGIEDVPERETTPRPGMHARAQTEEYGSSVFGGYGGGSARNGSTVRTAVPEEDEGEEDVTAMFQRSVSLDARPSSTSGLGLSSGGMGSSFVSGFGGGTNGFGISPMTAEPTLSFGSSDGSVWTPPSNPFATSSAASLPGSPPFGSGTYVPPTSHNPFSDSTLSFGGSDGSITSWQPRPKKTPTLPSNPWDT